MEKILTMICEVKQKQKKKTGKLKKPITETCIKTKCKKLYI